MRAVALILALLISTIASIDALCCADGCARSGVAEIHAPSPPGTDCPVCQPGSIGPPAVLTVSNILLALPPVRLLQRPPDAFVRPLDHPPRSS